MNEGEGPLTQAEFEQADKKIDERQAQKEQWDTEANLTRSEGAINMADWLSPEEIALMAELDEAKAQLDEELGLVKFTDADWAEAVAINEAVNRDEMSVEEAQTPDKESKAVALMTELKEKNLGEALGEYMRIEQLILKDKAKLDLQTKLIFRNPNRTPENRKPTSRELLLARQIRGNVEANKEAQENLKKSSPEAFYGINLLEFRKYIKQGAEGRLVEVPYTEENLNDIIDDLGKGNVTFLYGETGSGKTEIARLTARRYSDKDELLIRGYSGMGPEEFYGHLGLTATSINKVRDIPDKIQEEFAAWEKAHTGIAEPEREEAKRIISERVLNENSATISEYVLGAIYKAAAEGRVVIVDEATYIPPGLLASLNDIMTKVPGEKINVQGDGVEPIIVKEGFGIIMTGNLNKTGIERYKDRIGLDPALVDRLTIREYDYLPQKLEGGADSTTDIKEKQVYMVALAALAKDNGSIDAPEGTLDKLWNLSVLSRITQMAFTGRIEAGSAYSFQQEGAGLSLRTDLAITPRGLQRIIGEWQKDQQKYEIDYYLYKHLIARATNPTQQAYLYQQAQKCGFFRSDGWEQNPDYGKNGELQQFEINVPRNEEQPPTHISAIEIIQYLHGKPPKREAWPTEVETKRAGTQEKAEQIRQLEEEFDKLTAKKEEWFEKIGKVCPYEVNNAGAPEPAAG